MNPYRILQLCHFTIAKALHGGQRRVKAIYDGLRANPQLEVHFLGLYNLNDSPHEEFWRTDFERPSRKSFERESMLLDDYNLGCYFALDSHVYTKLSQKIKSLQPHVIQLEHPWLWPFVKKFITEEKDFAHTKIVYSSHNIEWRLKVSLLHQFRISNVDVWGEKIFQLEKDLFKHAQLVIAVTDYDRNELERMGDFPKKTYVLPNGMDRLFLPERVANHANPFALFVASGHPPNVRGYMEYMGPYLSYIRPDHKIHIVGRVSEAIAVHPQFLLYKELNEARTLFLGEVDDQKRLQELADCHCIVLPISEASGSNLKTAEALLARKPIIASSIAMRGYEEFIHEPIVTVCDDPQSFQKAISQVMLKSREELNLIPLPDESKLSRLTWPSIMAPLPDLLIKSCI